MFTPEMLALRRASAAGGAPDTHAITGHITGSDSVTIWDISDPSSPTAVGNVGSTMAIGTWWAVKSGYLYTGRNAAVYVYDVSDPTSPSYVTNVGLGVLFSNITMAWAHPDKDFIVVHDITSDRSAILDISNPASPTLNGSEPMGGNAAAPNADFTKFFVLQEAGTGIKSFALSNTDPSGTSSTESLSITSDARNVAAYGVSPVNGEGYLWHGGNDYIAAIKMGGDDTPDSEVYEADSATWDRVDYVFPFSNYYSETYESVAAVNPRDDDKIMVVGLSGSTFTVLASDVPSTISLLAYGMWVTGNYIISVDTGADRMYIHEWDAETSLTLLSDTYDATYLDGANKVITYTP